jgi:membrane-associated phospholipid phosphatase
MKNKYFVSFFISLLILIGEGYSQDIPMISKDSVIQNDTIAQFKGSDLLRNNIALTTAPAFTFPYNISFKKDGLVVASAIGVGALGYVLISNKRDPTLEEVNNKNPDNLPFFDRWSAGYYSKKADRHSYTIFYASYLYPVLGMFLNKNIHDKIKQVALLFVETISISSAMYTMSDGLIYRSRPYVYGDIAPLDLRTIKRSERSFYSGHISTVAAASFFMARVHKDFKGKAKLQPWLWGIAAALPAVMAYERIKAGYHFLSDCVFSYGIGAATGLLVPAMHKSKKLQNVSLLPQIGNGYQGVSFALNIK